MLRIIPLLILLLAVTIIVVISFSSGHVQRILWTAAPDEDVKWLRSDKDRLFVGSERAERWYLREVDLHNHQVRTIAEGQGRMQSVGSITHPDWQGKKLLLGLYKRRDPAGNYYAVECDLRSGKTQLISELSAATTFNLEQPYSPDGNFVALAGSKEQKDPANYWILERITGNLTKVTADPTPHKFLTWANNGKLYIYSPGTGDLTAGDGYHLRPVCKLARGFCGFVYPDGKSLLIVQQDSNALRVIKAAIPSGKSRIIYERSLGVESNIDISGINYSSDFQQAVVNISGANPLLVSQDGHVSEIHLLKSMLWCSSACAVVVQPDVVALVERSSEDAPQRVVTMCVD